MLAQGELDVPGQQSLLLGGADAPGKLGLAHLDALGQEAPHPVQVALAAVALGIGQLEQAGQLGLVLERDKAGYVQLLSLGALL
ncbi:hypothetical protein D3C85_1413540 [compost metagenome]